MNYIKNSLSSNIYISFDDDTNGSVLLKQTSANKGITLMAKCIDGGCNNFYPKLTGLYLIND